MYVLFLIYGAYAVLGLVVGWFQSIGDVGVSYFVDPWPSYFIGRILTATAGALTVAVTFLIGERLYDRKVGIVAALFLSFAYLHTENSHYSKPDILMSLLVALSFLFAIEVYHKGTIKYYLLAGLTSGFAIGAKYNAGLIVIPLLFAHALRIWKGKPCWRTVLGDWRPCSSLALGALTFLVSTPFSVLDFATFRRFMVGITEQAGTKWFGMENTGSTWLYVLMEVLPEGMGLALAIVCLLGLFYTLFHRRAADWFLLFFPVAYYLFMGRYTHTFSHYWLPTFPFLLLAGARLLCDAVGWLKVHPVGQRVLWVIILGGLLAEPTYKTLLFDYRFGQPDTLHISRKWIESNIPAGAEIVLEGHTPRLVPDTASLEVLLSGANPFPAGSVDEFQRINRPTQSMLEDTTYSKTHGAYVRRAYAQLAKVRPVYALYQVPFVGAQPPEYYRKLGVEYVVISSFGYGHVSNAEAFYPQMAANYKRIRNEWPLMKRVTPGDWGPVGHTVEIYQVRSSR